MPILANPRHEAFAQAFVASLSSDNPRKNTATAAYIAAGYNARGRSANVCASRLLSFVDTVAARVRELQQQQLDRIKPKIDLSKERIGKRLHLASEIAERQDNATAIATCELGIAKVFHRIDQPQASTSTDFSNVTSMQDIGRKLLQQVGLREPDDVSIQEAIAANDALIAALEAIRDRAQGLTLEHQG